MKKRYFTIFYALFTILALSSAQTPTFNNSILGIWRIDSIKLYTMLGNIDTQTTDTAFIGNTEKFHIIGGVLHQFKLITFSSDSILYDGIVEKWPLSPKQRRKLKKSEFNYTIDKDTLYYQHETKFTLREDSLLFGNSSETYLIRQLSKSNLVLDGAGHTGGCHGYHGLIYCSKILK